MALDLPPPPTLPPFEGLNLPANLAALDAALADSTPEMPEAPAVSRHRQAESRRADPESPAPPLRRIETARMTDASLQPPRYVLSGVCPRGVVTLLGAHGGSGKSLLALTLAAHVAAGRAFGDIDACPGRALFVSLEDAGDVVLHRLRRITEAFGLSVRAVTEGLTILDGTDADAALATEYALDGVRRIGPTAAMHALVDAAAGHDLIVIDNASDAFDGSENDRRQVRAFMRSLAAIAKANDAGLILLAHIDKTAARFGSNANTYSGSTAWHNSARSRVAMLSDEAGVELVHEKANFGRARGRLRLTWTDTGVLVPAADGADLSAAQAESDRADALAVLAAMTEAIRKGETVRTGRTGSHTTRHVLEAFPDALPKAMRGGSKAAKERFWRAVDTCQRLEWIEREAYTDGNRNTRERFALTPAAASVLGSASVRCTPHTPRVGTDETNAGCGARQFPRTDETNETDADAYRETRGEA